MQSMLWEWGHVQRGHTVPYGDCTRAASRVGKEGPSPVAYQIRTETHKGSGTQILKSTL